MNNQYWRYSAIFVLGLLLGIGSTWLWFTRDTDQVAQNADIQQETGMVGDDEDSSLVSENGISGVVTEGGYSVSVSDQFPGLNVELEKVVFAESGWAAVYEDNNGEPGNILGARRFDAGESTGTIQLLRAMEEDLLYYVILHLDDGDRQFDFKKDNQILNVEGSRVEAMFKTPPHRN